ncbi:hypothetical protein Ancab_021434 [Ancistrocladus abbreviatus]
MCVTQSSNNESMVDQHTRRGFGKIYGKKNRNPQLTFSSTVPELPPLWLFLWGIQKENNTSWEINRWLEALMRNRIPSGSSRIHSSKLNLCIDMDFFEKGVDKDGNFLAVVTRDEHHNLLGGAISCSSSTDPMVTEALACTP